MKTPEQALYDECMKQVENCAYSAAGFTIWLRWLRRTRALANLAPVLFGALATWKIVDQTSPVSAAVFTFLATVIPLLYRAAKIDHAIAEYTFASGEFTNLRDGFSLMAETRAQAKFADLDIAARPLLVRLEKLRAQALTPPEFCFIKARKKIKAGHYAHDYVRRDPD